ncbi:MAG: PSD1 and planctomycete cytochrome C domain-containing protein [Planctomycetaceae bacterium]
MIRHYSVVTGLLLIAVVDCNAVRAGDDSTAVLEKPTFSVEQIEFFESEVRPVLVEHCYKCHSTDASELQAGLYVDSREAMIRGGESGAAVVVGKPMESLLIAAVKHDGTEMPPDRKLEQRKIEALIKWVEMGAPWPEVTSSPGVAAAEAGIDWATFDWTAAKQSHWAWQSVQRPEVPVVSGVEPSTQIVNPIDSFVVARRTQVGLKSVPPASPHLLARRICIDLTGIPPTPDQVRSFAKAASVDRQRAVEAFVDELLESPMYGQRWARHWLDVARFSDGRGGFLEGDKPLDDAWRYRDWVVDVFNRDLPIDEFIHLQIAGDLTGDPLQAIATGFFALGPTYQSDGGDPDSIAQSRAETLDDRVDILTRGLLGITGSCARCHDHKFDPIPQQDYYSLAGIFNNSAMRNLPVPAEDVDQRFNDHNQAVVELRKKIRSIRKQSRKNESNSNNDDASREKGAPEDKTQLDALTAELAELEKYTPPAQATAHTLYDTGSEDMKVALRGNLLKTGEVAPRRFLRIVSGAEPTRFTKGSGREELAAAIVDPQNPLTSRVFVNRVWQHHFGAGLVRTPGNFGTLGERPTHPELLDWLTSEFIARGWSLKSLHRLIMTSATYQLGSDYEEHSFKSDGDNRLLWRMNPRRMDVEAWRDSLLSVTGELDTALGGPSLQDISSTKRRTLYAKVGRNGDAFESDVFLRLFDFPLMRSTVDQRPSSIVPQQFLFLMNSQFMVDRAKAFVVRLHQMSDSDKERIRHAYELLYSRSPEPMELEIGLSFVSAASDGTELSGWDRYAQVLLSSNEFMFVR